MASAAAPATMGITRLRTGTPTEPSMVLPQQEDSLNLIKLVGVPVLKRVIPIAAGAAALAIFTRFLRNRLRHSKS